MTALLIGCLVVGLFGLALMALYRAAALCRDAGGVYEEDSIRAGMDASWELKSMAE